MKVFNLPTPKKNPEIIVVKEYKSPNENSPEWGQNMIKNKTIQITNDLPSNALEGFTNSEIVKI